MKTGLSIRILCVLLFAGQSLPMVAQSLEAEKQKIIEVITGEVDAWFKKDRAKWMNAIVHSEDLVLSQASQNGYFRIHGFDSLVAPTAQHFATPADPNVKRISKTDFKIIIKGSITIVDLTLRGDNIFGPFIGDQTILMERQGKSWKIFRQATVVKTSYQPREVNIEAGLNTQGLRFLELKKFDEAIKVLTLNTQLFPNSWNTWIVLQKLICKKGRRRSPLGFSKNQLS